MQAPETYNGQAIVVLGDALTMSEVEEFYKRGSGKSIPSAPDLVARGILAMNKQVRGM